MVTLWDSTINYNISNNLNKNIDKLKSPAVMTVAKKDLIILLPYLGFKAGKSLNMLNNVFTSFILF